MKVSRRASAMLAELRDEHQFVEVGSAFHTTSFGVRFIRRSGGRLPDRAPTPHSRLPSPT